MDKFTEIEVFLRIAEEGSLAGAARKLQRTASSVSKILKALEDRLGIPLITRTTRSLTLTDAGKDFNARWRDILAEIEEAENLAGRLHSEVSGHLRIVGVNVLTQPLFLRVIKEFLDRHPGITVDLVKAATMPSLAGTDADIGLRIGQLSGNGLICEPIVPSYRIICAAPSYIERHGHAATFAELKNHNCLVFSINPMLNIWEIERDGRILRIQPQGDFAASHGDLLRLAALDGLGITQLADVLIGPDLRAGRLIPLFPEQFERPISQLCAIYPRRGRTPRKITAFVDYLRDALLPVPPWYPVGHDAPAGALSWDIRQAGGSARM